MYVGTYWQANGDKFCNPLSQICVSECVDGDGYWLKIDYIKIRKQPQLVRNINFNVFRTIKSSFC